ncbi:MAG: DUF1566 domain-containing protein [Methylococcus sp.]
MRPERLGRLAGRPGRAVQFGQRPVHAGEHLSPAYAEYPGDQADGGLHRTRRRPRRDRATLDEVYAKAIPTQVPKTGQTTSYRYGDDGGWQTGVPAPSPRFTDNNNGTVTDQLTGLVWLKDADCLNGATTWSQAIDWSNTLASGACGLGDGSTARQWRLPTIKELQSLIDFGQSSPALPAGHPFTFVQSQGYWSSTTVASGTGQAWGLGFADGNVALAAKTGGFYVWPVWGSSTPPALKIGDTYQGGIIFYLDGSGQHGLIAAASDQSAGIVWWNGSYVSTGATGTAVGTGQANTTAIVNAQGPGSYAASVADNLVLNGYSDWFLPSIDELNLMYTTIGPVAAPPLTNIGGFGDDLYWSSSDWDGFRALAYNFGEGDENPYYKENPLRVRPVRAF